ncbi:MAG: D-alanyl-D-alanine carboxypeptidase [Lachnospiraceae bacterium]|nr:D-alanyl-D-alanine carboxypeptidase [Lachnospiraceae bacterium]
MKLKLFLCALFCMFVFTGCGRNNLLLDYTEKRNNISSFASVSDGNNLTRITPFSEEVCVIPKEEVGVNVTDNFPASGLLMVDITDNKMYYADGIYDKLYPASLTKLATALVCFKYGNMNDDVTISYTASHINESGAKLCFLQEGDVINFETLLNSFLVYSGNDAGIALAEHISGSEKEFVKLMNKELKSLGAVNTHFVNSHGLPDDDHYTSVYDIYLILNELAGYDQFLEISSQSEYIAEFYDKAGNKVRKVYDNTNMYLTGHKKLPKGYKIVAGKTGTTNAAGNCLAIIASGPNSHNYIAICMKAYSYDSLYGQINDLLKLAK